MGGITTVGLGPLPSISNRDTTPQYPVPSPKDLHILPACLFLPEGYLERVQTLVIAGLQEQFRLRPQGGASWVERLVTSAKGQGSERAVRPSVLPPWFCKAKSSKDLSFLGDFH